MATDHAFVAPGQRYGEADLAPWRVCQQITLLAVHTGTDGVRSVTYRCPGGGDVTGLAARLEAAIAAGLVVPVGAAGGPRPC